MKKVKPKPEAGIPHWLVWFYALVSIVIIPSFYYEPAVDVTLVPKFMLLSGLLVFALLFLLITGRFVQTLSACFRWWPVRIWALFVLVSVLSLVVAINYVEGIFDILRLLVSGIYLMVTIVFLVRARSIFPFVMSATLLALGFSLIGFSQYFTHAFRSAELHAFYNVIGMMSHKNVFSVVLFLTMPLIVYGLLTISNAFRGIALFTLFLSLTLLFVLQTRSVWLALLVFAGVASVLLYLYRKSMVKAFALPLRRLAIMMSVTLLVAFLSAFLLTRYSIGSARPVALSDEVEKVESLEKRVASIFDTTSPNRIKRLDIWMRTLEIFMDHPVMGVGAGNWKVVVPDYYRPDPDESYYHNWRRPHNDYLWVLAEKGVPGFVLFLLFFLSVGALLYRTLKSKVSGTKKGLSVLAFAGICGYCTDAFFAFPYDRVDTLMLMMLMVALIIYAAWPLADSATDAEKKNTQPERKGKALVFVLMAMLAIGLILGQRMIKSEVHTKQAKALLDHQQWERAISESERAYRAFPQLDPVNNPLLWYKGNALMNMGRLEEARYTLEKALVDNPYSVATMSDLAMVLYLQNEFAEAERVLDKSLKIYPMNRYALQILGLTYYATERYQEAAEVYYRCITDQPNPTLDSLIRQVAVKLYGEEVLEQPSE